MTPESNQDYKNMDVKRLEEEEGLSLTDLPSAELCHEDKDKLESIVIDLWTELKGAKDKDDHEQINLANKKFKDAKNHLLKEYGIFTTVSRKGPRFLLKYRLKEDAERARSNATKHIKGAIEDMKNKKKLPLLGAHLEKCIKTGNKFRYETEKNKPIERWSILWNN